MILILRDGLGMVVVLVIRRNLVDAVSVPVLAVISRRSVGIEKAVPVFLHLFKERVVHDAVGRKAVVLLVSHDRPFRIRAENAVRLLKQPAGLEKQPLHFADILALVAVLDGKGREGGSEDKHQGKKQCLYFPSHQIFTSFHSPDHTGESLWKGIMPP